MVRKEAQQRDRADGEDRDDDSGADGGMPRALGGDLALGGDGAGLSQHPPVSGWAALRQGGPSPLAVTGSLTPRRLSDKLRVNSK